MTAFPLKAGGAHPGCHLSLDSSLPGDLEVGLELPALGSPSPDLSLPVLLWE